MYKKFKKNISRLFSRRSFEIRYLTGNGTKIGHIDPRAKVTILLKRNNRVIYKVPVPSFSNFRKNVIYHISTHGNLEGREYNDNLNRHHLVITGNNTIVNRLKYERQPLFISGILYQIDSLMATDPTIQFNLRFTY